MPVDLTAQLTAPQAGPTAAPRVVRTNPFAAVDQTTGSQRLRAFGAGMGGFGGQFVTQTLPAERQQQRLGIAQQLLGEKIQQLKAAGLNSSSILNGVINSDEFITAISELPAGDIFDFVTKMASGISEPPPEALKLSPGDVVVNKDPVTGKISKDPAYNAPTQTEQLVSAIKRAEDAGDKKSADLLRARLLTNQPGGQIGVGDALKLRVAGVKNTGRSVVDGMSPEQASAALNAAKSGGSSTLPLMGFVLRGLGKQSGNPEIDKLSPDEAAVTAQAYQDLHGSDNFVQQLMQSIAGQKGADVPGLSGGRKSIQEYRKELQGKTSKGEAGTYSKLTDAELGALVEDVLAGRKQVTAEERAAIRAEVRKRTGK